MIEQRIAELELDLWYTSRFRSWQWQACHEAYTFTWMVAEVRRVHGDERLWGLILDQLHDWQPSLIH